MHRQLMITLALLLGGCSTLSPYSQVTKLELQLDADEHLNPDIQGRPSPVVLRLLELKTANAFNDADFFSLYQRPREILAADLAGHEEVQIRPGERLTLKRSLQPGNRYLGVIAAYRDLPQANWRLVIPVPAQAITRTTVRLDDHALSLSGD